MALPDSARRAVIGTPGGVLAALDARPPGPARASAVLVPGFGGSKEDFIPMLAALAGAGYRVVCYDQRGQYQSAGPATSAAYSMELFTHDLIEVIHAVGGDRRLHLLGHSFGGLVARRAAIAVPGSVRSLTLLACGPDGASLSRQRLLGPLSWLIRLGGPTIVAAVGAWAEAKGGAPADRLPWIRRRLLATTPASLAGICRAMAAEPDLVNDLAQADVPVLVVCGEHDDGWPPKTQLTMARRLAAPAIVIKDAGHTPNEDQPQATAHAVVRFWTAIDAGPQKAFRASPA